VTTIFTEELVSPRVAETLAREAGGLKTETLNPLEGLSDDEIDAGADYLSVMRDNLQSLRDALGCS
jgi:zinc transport system substrate-binding protein